VCPLLSAVKGACTVKEKAKKASVKPFIYRDNTVGYIFAFPFIFGFICFSLIPILTSLYYAFTDFSLGSKTAEWVGLKNFGKLLEDEVFRKSLWVTLKYVVLSVPLKLAFALFVAFLLTRKSRLVTLYRSLYYVPSLVGGSVAVILVWKQLFARKGLFNSVLAGIGLSTINWFGDQKLAMVPLILMSVWQFGSSMIIFAAGLKEIPVTYYEAAKIDGANGFQSFFKITLPCLSPIILYNLVMQTISAFMVFTQVAVMTDGGPNNSTMVYALYVYKQAFSYNHMGYACAMAWVMLVIMSAITLVIFKTSKKWVFSEADS
jgi:multiple sugar transport system permease protein